MITTDYFNLIGKTAQITGCSSRIGEAFAIGFAETSSNFMDDAGTIAKDSSVEKEVARHYTNFLFYAIDLDKRTPAYEGIKEIKSAQSSVNIFINNADSILRNSTVNHSEEDGDKGSTVP